ncbi:MAG: carboxypeptidase regulatory-like domain-containing protein [Acidobacteriota bacterium]|nr:carboxypeptidase regulatory-like domain-containing protein [Acidobacteriota bacterium]
MKIKAIFMASLLLIALAPAAFSQSRETGAIEGTVMDEQRAPLPGVSVTVSGPSLMGTRSVVTDVNGRFRVPALPPGVYAIRAELTGFSTTIQENVRLSTTVTINVNLTMMPATITEEVTIIAVAPTVDVRSTETASVTLSKEILQNVPYSNFAMDIVNLAPGVSGNAAYGATASTGVSYQVDGVDVSDPEAGSAWVFIDPNIVEEAKIMGIGLPAEYGNFTGVIFNLVTKSGGNEFSGYLSGILQDAGTKDDEGKFQSNFWQADNTGAYQDDFPNLTPPGLKLYDAAFNLGGPFIKDKLWFFAGAQWYHTFTKVTGFPEDVEYKQPRLFLKLNSQLSPRTNLGAFIENDTYNGINRRAAANRDPEATVRQTSPDWVGSFNLTHILSPKTFFDVKGAFFDGYYYLDPEMGMDVNAIWDLNDNFHYGNSNYFYKADRARYQANASLTHYAEDFITGSHDFKFGVEFESATSRNRFGYTGTNATWYLNYTGWGYTGPYLAYQYEGYDTEQSYTRFEQFIQDNWAVSDRLNISVGLRATQMRGTVEGLSGAVYTNSRIAPRLGFTFDLLGDKSTVLKAHYGQFTEAMLAQTVLQLSPAENFSDYVGYYWDLGSEQWVEFFRDVYDDTRFVLDPDIKHPHMNQFTVALERELFKDTSVGIAYIHRDWKNPQNRVDLVANWVPRDVAYTDIDGTTKTITVYQQTNRGENQFLITNLEKNDPRIPYFDINPYRQYRGLQFTFNKRFSNRWQMVASYVYSQARGTLDNAFGADLGGAWYNSSNPNFWINADGNLSNDPTHMIKIQGSYLLPLGINLNIGYQGITGYTWTKQLRTPRLAHGIETVRIEPRGSNYYPFRSILDMRLEKTVTIAERYRIGFMFDVFNLLNADTITSWGTRVGFDWFADEWSSTEGHQLYGVVRPRQARIGVRFTF